MSAQKQPLQKFAVFAARRTSSLADMLQSRPEIYRAKVAELVDALDLGSSAARRESSSLSFRTTGLFQLVSLSLNLPN
jgi:hypothetical protein